MNKEKALEMVKKLNEGYVDNLNIPILGGFKTISNPGTLFTAVSEEGFVEQFITDGKLVGGEDFDTHLNKVIDNTIKAMSDSGFEDPINNIRLHKKYTSHGINYVVYIQDNIATVEGKKRLIRQFNIYFVEPKSSEFHLLTLATPPFGLPNDYIIVDKIDLENDKVTKNLNETVVNMIKKITYK